MQNKNQPMKDAPATKSLGARIISSLLRQKHQRKAAKNSVRFEPEKYGLTPIFRISGRSRRCARSRYADKIPRHLPKAQRRKAS